MAELALLAKQHAGLDFGVAVSVPVESSPEDSRVLGQLFAGDEFV